MLRVQKIIYIYQNYTNDYSSASLSILRGLKQQEGITVEEFEIKPLSYSNNINRILNKIQLLKTFYFRHQNRQLQKKTTQGNYDFLFVMKGTDVATETLKQIKKENDNLRLICFNPDDPFNKASSNKEIVAAIPLYDFYCIWTKHLDKQLKAAGANELVYLPFGIDNEIIYPVAADYKYDISFIGNGDEERHRLILDLDESLLKNGLAFKIHVFGSNWPIKGKNIVIHGQRNGEDLLKTIAASKINLNLLRKQNKNSINMRTFEIPAAGGFMIHEKSEEAQMYFKPDEDVVYFDSIQVLVDKCIIYLNNENERSRVIHKYVNKLKQRDYSYYNFIKTYCYFLLTKKTD